MEKQQLDFTAPLLSVRSRGVKSIHEKAVPVRQNTLLDEESDLNFDHVTTAAVPFVWEDIPGKARKELADCYVLGSRKKGSCDMESYDDGTYTDVLDAFSQSTASRDCSVSSWSVSDGHGLEPSRTFCETQDFVLRRFLPAAKAMTLELPCHVFKKQPLGFANEKPTEEIKEMVDQKPILKRNDSWTSTYFDQGKEEQEREPEVDHDSQKSIIRLVNSRSFLPRFCIKSCSSLLNQVVDMQHTIESAKGRLGEARRHKKAYRVPSLPAPLISPSIVEDTIYNHRHDDATHTAKPSHARNSDHLQTARRSSLTPNKCSHYRKKVPVSPRDTTGSTGIHKAAGPGHNKACDQKVTPDKTSVLGPGWDHESPPIDKTLHMDLVKAFSNLRPPLPKSPSDSWLSRTLPSVPLTPSSSTKWENIVKTSYLYRDHVRYSQVTYSPTYCYRYLWSGSAISYVFMSFWPLTGTSA